VTLLSPPGREAMSSSGTTSTSICRSTRSSSGPEILRRDDRPEEELQLQFEALSAMPPAKKAVAKAVLDASIVNNQVAGALERFSTIKA
jgi:hypothetical protein